MGYRAVRLLKICRIIWKLAIVFGLVPQIDLLHRLGFRSAGVAHGTVASWLHSLQGGVVARRGMVRHPAEMGQERWDPA
ncbi:hypothetical protein MTO96_023650 [Rhipicephalus appendiculatus]